MFPWYLIFLKRSLVFPILLFSFTSFVHSPSRVWLFATLWTRHARLPCPSPSPGVCSNSHPLCWWCHPTISSLSPPSLLPSSFTLYFHWRISSYFLLFSGTLHSVEYIFPFLPCLSLLFFPQLFVKPPQTTTLPSCISFALGWFWSLPPVQCYESLSSGTLFFRYSQI